MSSGFTVCPHCQNDLSAEAANTGIPAPCPTCGASVLLYVWPALFKENTVVHDRRLDSEQEDSRCFYHDTRAGQHICDGCGRFLCQLCSLHFEEKTLCTSCIEKGMKEKKIPVLETEFVRNDIRALTLALLPHIIAALVLFFTMGSILYDLSLLLPLSAVLITYLVFALPSAVGSITYMILARGNPAGIARGKRRALWAALVFTLANIGLLFLLFLLFMMVIE